MTWIVRRARFYAPGGDGYIVRKGTPEAQQPPTSYRELTDLKYIADHDDGKQVMLGDEPWPEVPCPDCDTWVAPAEAGFVPGHRICPRCGAHWELTTCQQEPKAEPRTRYGVEYFDHDHPEFGWRHTGGWFDTVREADTERERLIKGGLISADDSRLVTEERRAES